MKPKLLFVLHLAPPVHGAAVAGGFIRESKVINEPYDITYINLSTASSVADIGKTGFKKFIVILKLWYKVFLALNIQKYQLCYLTINAKGPAWIKELGIVALVKVFQIPLIYHYHNKGVAENATSLFKKKLYSFQFKNAKSILLSPLLYRDIADFAIGTEVYYCPNGIPTITLNQTENLIKNESKIATILFLSNLIESKGVFILLQACVLLKNKNIPFQCVFIGGEGDITTKQFQKKVQQSNLQNEVEYQGRKYGLEKEAAFANADIFAFPTYYHNETFGLVNLEAMQYALPVISTFEGAIPEVIIDGVNGFLVPQQNAEALASKLEILIGNPVLRNEMGLAGKKMYEEKFTLEHFEKRMLEILQAVLE
ncbi:glycosyltransferase family 4 protein [Flavobacterium cellulosilyticum]|uniref:Glycosyltransferase n=1 Tax=Flavobacterium cellulosilyticum TaxID=2541731 RepID=A0A4R5CA47_9FLAO|nr:glycosyltransferase family 4 protein [Flavobacterium cellulosilyticum]TDD95073.1 glycosyltransferase [Flavobacterium cellulosilyticum]